MSMRLLLAARVLLGFGAAGMIIAAILFFKDKVWVLMKERRKRPAFKPSGSREYLFEGETELMEMEDE